MVSKFDFFGLFVLSKTVENENFKNGMILIQKFAFKKMYSAYKKLILQSKVYLSRNRMWTIYLSAIIFDIYDALATWYIHIAAQIQILYQALETTIQRYINTTCHVLIAATCIILNK